jgi:phosphohistidine phosphatase SixA
MSGYEDGARQRNLTDAGRADARAIGAAIRALGIPIGRVLASPFCRTRETAELIFGRATVSNAVRGGPAQASWGSAKVSVDSRRWTRLVRPHRLRSAVVAAALVFGDYLGSE